MSNIKLTDPNGYEYEVIQFFESFILAIGINNKLEQLSYDNYYTVDEKNNSTGMEKRSFREK